MLPGPVALLVQDICGPIERCLVAEAHEMNLLAAELRLVANSIERALAGCLDHRLAIDTRRLLDELKRHRGGTPPSLGPPALAEVVAQWNHAAQTFGGWSRSASSALTCRSP